MRPLRNRKLYHRLFANLASNLQITGREWPASAVLSLVTFRRMDFCFKPKRCGSLSVLRRKQIFVPQKVMSALPPKADIYGALADVRRRPKTDISHSRCASDGYNAPNASKPSSA